MSSKPVKYTPDQSKAKDRIKNMMMSKISISFSDGAKDALNITSKKEETEKSDFILGKIIDNLLEPQNPA